MMAVVMGGGAYTHQTHAYVLKACTEPHTCLFPILANQAVLSTFRARGALLLVSG